jgi:acetyl-CoA decarbonylase/synthase complex subunit epsilon
MKGAEPWQTAEIPGPIKAFVISEPARISSILKSARRPLFIIGNRIDKRALEQGIISLIVDIARAIDADIAVYGGIYRDFKATNYDKVRLVPSMEVIDRVKDENWMGFDGKGRYDVIIFLGFPYYYEWLMLSGLKHYGDRRTRTLSLDPFYQPNATISMINMDIDKWIEVIKEIRSNLLGGE